MKIIREGETREQVMRRVAEAYDPSDPTNIIGMMYPTEEGLREIVAVEIVDGKLAVRLGAVPESVTIAYHMVPVERGPDD